MYCDTFQLLYLHHYDIQISFYIYTGCLHFKRFSRCHSAQQRTQNNPVACAWRMIFSLIAQEMKIKSGSATTDVKCSQCE